jgi:hypothetical protein
MATMISTGINGPGVRENRGGSNTTNPHITQNPPITISGIPSEIQ